MKFQRPTKSISFRDWLRMLEDGDTEKVLLTAIFPPRDYPNWTLTFVDELRHMRVRKSIKNEDHIKELRAWAQRLKGARCKAYLNITLDEGAVEITFDGTQPDPNYEYQQRHGGLVLTKVTQEDIPF